MAYWDKLFQLEETADTQRFEAADTEIKESALKSAVKSHGEYKNVVSQVNKAKMKISAKIEQTTSEFEKNRYDLEKFKKYAAKNQEKLEKYSKRANDSKIKVNEIAELNNACKEGSDDSVDLLEKELMALQSELNEMRSKKLHTLKE